MPERRVIKNLGASEAGRRLAAETAEIVFAAYDQLATQAFYADVKSRAARAGRDPDAMRVLPGALVVVGDNVDQARDKHARFDAFVHADSSIATLLVALGHDAATLAPDAPLPDIPPAKATAIALVQREGLTVRQLAQRLGGCAGLAFVGAPHSIADGMEQWLVKRGSDGFNVMFPYLPEGLDDVADKLIPELQRRGLFRREHPGTTLRETLGLLGPGNRFFSE